jgi:hypothetical protein
MSQFYDLASLVVIPSGYKASTIYAQKPLTTDGQLSFSRASTATRVNASGLIEAVASNVPRLDYLNSSCPRLNLEPQRTNLLTFSESFDNAAWTKSGAVITANAAVSPDGYQNADKLIPNSASQGILQQNHNITAGQANTLSVFAKYDGLNDNFALNSRDNASAANAAQIAFNLSTGTIATAATASGSYSAASGTITSYGNGWYRLTLTHSSSISTTTRFRYFNETASGDGTNGYLVYGAQAEINASYATSYIPTLSASVTRVADTASKTGISSLIGQSEGTLFINPTLIHTTTTNEYFIQVRQSNSSRIFIYREANTNKIACFALIGGSTIYTALTAGAVTGTFKAAFAYKSGSFAFYVNGTQVGTSTATFTTPSLTEFFIDQNAGLENGFHAYNQALLFTTRLTNAQLAELTTL